MDLRGAELSGSWLHDARLNGANLTGATMINAHLHGAHLTNALLRDADLRGVIGMSADQIRAVADTERTRF